MVVRTFLIGKVPLVRIGAWCFLNWYSLPHCSPNCFVGGILISLVYCLQSLLIIPLQKSLKILRVGSCHFVCEHRVFELYKKIWIEIKLRMHSRQYYYKIKCRHHIYKNYTFDEHQHATGWWIKNGMILNSNIYSHCINEIYRIYIQNSRSRSWSFLEINKPWFVRGAFKQKHQLIFIRLIFQYGSWIARTIERSQPLTEQLTRKPNMINLSRFVHLVTNIQSEIRKKSNEILQKVA